MANAVGTPQHIDDLKKQAEKLKQEIRVSVFGFQVDLSIGTEPI